MSLLSKIFTIVKPHVADIIREVATDVLFEHREALHATSVKPLIEVLQAVVDGYQKQPPPTSNDRTCGLSDEQKRLLENRVLR